MTTPAKFWREDGAVCFSRVGSADLLKEEGVFCSNPEAPEAQREYVKRFTKKTIYLPGEYDRAIKEVLSGKDTLILAANGYSDLTDEVLRTWGCKPGAYEAACTGLLHAVYQYLIDSYPGIQIRIVHGASYKGIDRVLIDVATELNIRQLGFNCPQWMFYVKDDDVPCYVAESKEAYAEAFVDALDILIACNGREQAFKHDLMATFLKLKQLIPINVLKAVSRNGGPPALNADGKIEDAVAAYEQHVHMVGQSLQVKSRDPFADLVEHTCDVVVGIARNHLSVQRGYANPPLFVTRGVRARSA